MQKCYWEKKFCPSRMSVKRKTPLKINFHNVDHLPCKNLHFVQLLGYKLDFYLPELWQASAVSPSPAPRAES